MQTDVIDLQNYLRAFLEMNLGQLPCDLRTHSDFGERLHVPDGRDLHRHVLLDRLADQHRHGRARGVFARLSSGELLAGTAGEKDSKAKHQGEVSGRLTSVQDR